MEVRRQRRVLWLCSGVVLVLLAWFGASLRRSSSRVQEAAQLPVGVATTDLHSASAKKEPPDDVVLTTRAPASADLTGNSKSSEQDEDVQRAVLTDLRAAIEASTYGRLDAGALLEAANLILACPLADRAIPEVTDQGEVIVPFLDTPAGLSADMSVGRSRFYGNVLSLNIRFAPQEDPYYLDGTLRNEMSCTLRAYCSADGDLARLGFLTLFEPDYKEMQRTGFPVDSATVVEGVLFSFDPSSSDGSKMKAYGWKEGQPSDWEIPTWIDGVPPGPAEAEQLSSRMMNLYQTLRRNGEYK